jgi:serine/threonine protein phosphatase 1
VEPDKIGIDTGAVYGNMLTCVQLPDEIFFQA